MPVTMGLLDGRGQDLLEDKRMRGAHAIQAAALRRPRDPLRLAWSLPLGPSGAGQVRLHS